MDNQDPTYTDKVDSGALDPKASYDTEPVKEELQAGSASSSEGGYSPASHYVVGDPAMSSAHEAGAKLEQKAEAAVDIAKKKTESLLDGQKGRAAETLDGISSAFRTTADQLRNQDRPVASEYAGRIAKRVDYVSNLLRQKDIGYFVNETENFARRRPEVFLGGAVALGLLCARFLKSTSPPDLTGGRTYRQREPEAPGATSFSQEPMSHI